MEGGITFMNKKILEKQGLVIGAVFCTWLGMKIRDIQNKARVQKEIGNDKMEEFFKN